MNKKLTMILVIIILILVAIIGFLVTKNSSNNNNNNLTNDINNEVENNNNNSNNTEKENVDKNNDSNIENNVENSNNEQQNANTVNYLTEDQAIEKLKATDYKKLDLPTNASEYKIEVFGFITINDVFCYEMGAFAELDGRSTNMGTFAVAKDGSGVYKIVNGKYEKIN